jgi:hypothetical protein
MIPYIKYTSEENMFKKSVMMIILFDFGHLAQAASTGDLISNFFVITVGASFRINM